MNLPTKADAKRRSKPPVSAQIEVASGETSNLPAIVSDKTTKHVALDKRNLGLDTDCSSGSPIDYTVMHSVAGRLRVRIDAIRNDNEATSRLLSKLSAIAQITGVRVNTWCATVVINYDPHEFSEDSLLSVLNNLNIDQPEVGIVQDASIVVIRPVSTASRLATIAQRLVRLVDRSFPPLIQLVFGAASFAVSALKFPVLISRTILGIAVVPIINRAFQTVLEEKRLGVDSLDGMAALLMIANGRLVEAGFMSALIGLGEFIRERTARRCEKIVTDLLGLKGRFAWLVKGNKRLCIPADEVRPGDVVVVYPGDMVPIDGLVVAGIAAVDQSKLTGEFIPVEVEKGHTVYASTVAVEGKIYVRCTASGVDTRAGLVLESLNNVPLHETRIQNYASVMADKLVVPIFIASGLCFALTRNLQRLMSMLIFDFCTGIRIAAPTAVLASMNRAGQHGILIKGGGALERLATVDAIVFDKTGTLTTGQPKVTQVISLNGYTEDQLVSLAASVEQRLHHPASRAITRYAGMCGVKVHDRASSTFVRGMGVKAEVRGKSVLVGSKRLMESESVNTDAAKKTELAVAKKGESLAYIAIDGECCGLISYSDHLRAEAEAALTRLKRMGIKKLIMATGDNDQAAKRIANSAGLEDVLSKAFPEQKADLVKQLKAAGYTVAVIGDGINDSPMMAHADVAISLHDGTEAARHSADVVLTDDDLNRLPEAITIARKAMGLVKQNLALAVVPNSSGLALAALGIVGPAGATLLNNGSAICAALNSLRPLYASGWTQLKKDERPPGLQ